MPTYEEAAALAAAAPDGEITLAPYTGGLGDLAYLRAYVLDAVVDFYGVDAAAFDTATLFSTTLLRDWAHRAMAQAIGRDYFEDLQAAGLTVSPLLQDVGAAFRYPATGQCGFFSWQLYNIYRAFGYDTTRLDTVNGEVGEFGVGEFAFNNSHSLVEVFCTDLDKFIVQDSMFNFLVRDDKGNPLSFYEARLFRFGEGGALDFDHLDIYTYYRNTGVRAEAYEPVSLHLLNNGWLKVPWSWMTSDTGARLYSVTELFPYPYWNTAHLQLPAGYKTFTSASAAAAAVLDIVDDGFNWQATAAVLRAQGYSVSGFKVVSATDKTILGEWLTVRLTDGGYASINVGTGEVLNGSLDQLWDDATSIAGGETGRNLNPGKDLSVFLNPVVLLQHNGFIIADWESEHILDQNHVPFITPVAVGLRVGESIDAAATFAVSDSDGDVPILVAFYDGTSESGSSFFYDNLTGSPLASKTTHILLISRLSDIQVNAGDWTMSVDLRVSVYDGIDWTSWRPLTLSHVNSKPVIQPVATTLQFNQTAAAASLFTVNDPDRTSPTLYEFWDTVPGTNDAFFFSDSVARYEAGIGIVLTPSQVPQLKVNAGSNGAADLWVRAYDGSLWSDWTRLTLTVTPPPNNKPVVQTVATKLQINQSITAASLFTVSDPDGTSPTLYEFWDTVPGTSDAFFFSNTVSRYDAGTGIIVTPAQLPQLKVNAGSNGAADLWVRAYDGTEWSDWTKLALTVNSKPIVSTVATKLSANETNAVSTLFSVSDKDGDAITRYQFWDSSASDGSAFFFSSAVSKYAAGQEISIAANALSDLKVNIGTDGATNLWVRAYDGGAWSDWTQLNIALKQPLSLASPVTTLSPGETQAVSNLFTVSSSNGDSARLYEFFDSSAGSSSAYFSSSTVAKYNAGISFLVTPAQLSDIKVTAALPPGQDNLWVRAHDGSTWSSWTKINVVTANIKPEIEILSGRQSAGTVLPVATMFEVHDANGTSPTRFEFWDSSVGDNTAFFSSAIVERYATGVAIPIAPADLAQVDVHFGTGATNLWVRAFDGALWSDWTLLA